MEPLVKEAELYEIRAVQNDWQLVLAQCADYKATGMKLTDS